MSLRNAKDSVFCDLFEKPEYLIQLYRALHPEDKKTQESDLTIVTLSSVFLKEIYNDLGFMLGNRLIVLVEEQATFSYNIVVRLLIYLAETYRRYIDRNELDEYSTTRIELPNHFARYHGGKLSTTRTKGREFGKFNFANIATKIP